MIKRFKFTLAFVVSSALILAITALIITRSVTASEQRQMTVLITEQSARDARVIAGVITDLVARTDLGARTSAGIAAPSGPPMDTLAENDSRAMSAIMRTSDVVRVALLNREGGLVWASSPFEGATTRDTRRAFDIAIAGSLASALEPDSQFVSDEGETTSVDLVETFVPLKDPVTGETTEVLVVSRDVTEELATRVEQTRILFRTIFSSMGGAFVVLLGLVITADTLISRSNLRSIANERDLADQRVAATELESENLQLRQIDRERERFLSMVSHELRTPLTSILAFTDVLSRNQRGDRRERNEDHLKVIRRNGEHLESLIQEMLEITRIKSGIFEIDREDFDLGPLLSDLEKTVSAVVAKRRQTIRVELPPRKTVVNADPRRIRQVLLNLVNNASQYSEDGAVINVSTRISGSSLTFVVVDDGPGIPEEDVKRLFDRFFRRDDVLTRSQSGLGLGLSIVRAIAESHGGTARLESRPGEGTTAVVTIPGAVNLHETGGDRRLISAKAGSAA